MNSSSNSNSNSNSNSGLNPITLARAASTSTAASAGPPPLLISSLSLARGHLAPWAQWTKEPMVDTVCMFLWYFLSYSFVLFIVYLFKLAVWFSRTIEKDYQSYYLLLKIVLNNLLWGYTVEHGICLALGWCFCPFILV